METPTNQTSTKRQGILLCCPLEERRILQWTPPFICQPKLDGERCRALVTSWVNTKTDKVKLVSSELNIFNSVPLISEALVRLSNKLSTNVELDGELYVHGWDFNEIHSVVSRKVNLHPQHSLMEFHVFDFVDLKLPQAKRLLDAEELVKLCDSPRVKLVPRFIAWTFDEVLKCYEKFLVMGYEGIIVRNFEAPYIRRRSLFVSKFKPKKTDVYRIVGFVEERDKYGNPKNRLGALVCQGDDYETFTVGSGLTDEERIGFWKNREGLTLLDCKVSYQHLTAKRGVPRFGTYLELVEREPEVEFQNPLEF